MGRLLKFGCLGVIGLVVLIAVIIAVVAIGGGGSDDEAPVLRGSGSTNEVIYKVTGTGGATQADMTFTTSASGSITQENGEKLPWTKTVEFEDEPLNFFSVSAQNRGGGELTCTVTVDGEEVASNTSSGRFAIVSCDESSGL